MDLLVATHSVALEQADKVSAQGVAQYATDGNPAQNIPATIFPAGHYNSVLAELVNAIKAGGLKPDRNQWDQLATIISGFKQSTDLFNKAIELKIIEISENQTTITADFNTGNNAFHGWTTFFASVEINRADIMSQNCLMFSSGQGENRKPKFYIAAADANFTIAAANSEDLNQSEILMNINKDTKEFMINGTINSSDADLAEYYHADQSDYQPGTLMMFGGEHEITICTDSANMFGVISTKPSLVMNNPPLQDGQYYPIVLTGKVPVRIIGKVKKHDRITIGGNGLAKSITDPTERVIGRALEDKQTDGEGMINCFVQALS